MVQRAADGVGIGGGSHPVAGLTFGGAVAGRERSLAADHVAEHQAAAAEIEQRHRLVIAEQHIVGLQVLIDELPFATVAHHGNMQFSQDMADLGENVECQRFLHPATDRFGDRSSLHPFHDEIRLRRQEGFVLELPSAGFPCDRLTQLGVPIEDVVVRVGDAVTASILEQHHNPSLGLKLLAMVGQLLAKPVFVATAGVLDQAVIAQRRLDEHIGLGAQVASFEQQAATARGKKLTDLVPLCQSLGDGERQSRVVSARDRSANEVSTAK